MKRRILLTMVMMSIYGILTTAEVEMLREAGSEQRDQVSQEELKNKQDQAKKKMEERQKQQMDLMEGKRNLYKNMIKGGEGGERYILTSERSMLFTDEAIDLNINRRVEDLKAKHVQEMKDLEAKHEEEKEQAQKANETLGDAFKSIDDSPIDESGLTEAKKERILNIVLNKLQKLDILPEDKKVIAEAISKEKWPKDMKRLEQVVKMTIEMMKKNSELEKIMKKPGVSDSFDKLLQETNPTAFDHLERWAKKHPIVMSTIGTITLVAFVAFFVIATVEGH